MYQRKTDNIIIMNNKYLFKTEMRFHCSSKWFLYGMTISIQNNSRYIANVLRYIAKVLRYRESFVFIRKNVAFLRDLFLPKKNELKGLS